MADIYAVGVILFMLATGYCPFKEASISDGHFRLLAMHRYKEFWGSHTPSGDQEDDFPVLSDDFKSLVTQMLAMQPFSRLEMVDIMSHPFFSGRFASSEEVVNAMKNRKQ